jgi:hypothetical protein
MLSALSLLRLPLDLYTINSVTGYQFVQMNNFLFAEIILCDVITFCLEIFWNNILFRDKSMSLTCYDNETSSSSANNQHIKLNLCLAQIQQHKPSTYF